MWYHGKCIGVKIKRFEFIKGQVCHSLGGYLVENVTAEYPIDDCQSLIVEDILGIRCFERKLYMQKKKKVLPPQARKPISIKWAK